MTTPEAQATRSVQLTAQRPGKGYQVVQGFTTVRLPWELAASLA